MHPAHAKAKQTMALVETAQSVASLKADINELAERIAALAALIESRSAPKKEAKSG